MSSAPTAESFDLELEVVDEAGAPVADAKVDVIVNDLVARTCRSPLPEEAHRDTDAAGRVTLRGLPALPFGERYYVVAVHPAYAEGILDRAERVPRVEGVASARITLPRGLEQAGRVVARAADRADEEEELIVRAVWADPSVPGCYGVVREARVEKDGSFRLDGLHRGRHLLLMLSGEAMLARTSVEVPSSEPLVVARVVTRDVSGFVTGEGGASLEGADVLLHSPVFFREAKTNAQGRFVIRDVAVSQTLELEVNRETPDYTELLGRCTLQPGEDDVDVCVDAQLRTPVDYEIRGWRSAMTILFVREESTECYGFRGCFSGPELTGRLWLHEGRHEVFAESGCSDTTNSTHYVTAVIEIRQAQPQRLVLDLVPNFDVAFDLKDETTGEPLAEARLAAEAIGLWGSFYSENTDPSGRVVLRGMGPVGFRLVAKATGYEPLEQEIQLREDMRVELRMRKAALS
jgi:hypothetical protein